MSIWYYQKTERSDELKHYGIKGMKWGRRKQIADAAVSPSNNWAMGSADEAMDYMIKQKKFDLEWESGRAKPTASLNSIRQKDFSRKMKDPLYRFKSTARYNLKRFSDIMNKISFKNLCTSFSKAIERGKASLNKRIREASGPYTGTLTISKSDAQKINAKTQEYIKKQEHIKKRTKAKRYEKRTRSWKLN